MASQLTDAVVVAGSTGAVCYRHRTRYRLAGGPRISFEELQQQKHRCRVRIDYAKKIASVLTNGDAKELLAIESAEKRRKVMLSALSKYLGCYDKWQDTRGRHSLRRTCGNEPLHAVHRFFTLI